MNALRTLTRYYVSDFDGAVALLEAVYGPRDLDYEHATHDLRVAVVGQALVIGGEPNELDKVRGAEATIVVDDLDAALALGGRSTGIVHVDGRRQATVEYLDGLCIEWAQLAP